MFILIYSDFQLIPVSFPPLLPTMYRYHPDNVGRNVYHCVYAPGVRRRHSVPEWQNILAENSPHVRNFHAFIGKMPELETVTVVCLIILFEGQAGVGCCRFRYIGFGNQLPAVPAAFV